MDEIADAPQPVGVFIAAPADPEEVVGPRITEPPATEAEKPKVEKPDSEELPDAPGPAAEALRYAKERQLGDGAQAEPLQGSTRSSMAPGEKQSVEKPELLPIPEGSTAETSRLNSEELENDRKKRKRRSDSPDVPSQDIRAKKARSSQEPMPEVHLKEDAEFQDQVHSSPKTEAPSQRRERTDRYHTLVDSVDISTPHKPAQDRPIVPALHPATPALYIRGFMRPLRPEPLRAHLISLASSPSGSPDPSIITSLFLDAMKTHALVLFASTAAASRVRASLHGAVWPPEGNRKELWADFVPEDKVTNWIRQEEDAIGAEKEARANGRSIPSQRFEVIYPESSDGQVTAMFQQVGGSGPTDVQRGREASRDAHRRPSAHPLPTAPSRDTRQDIEQSFKTLDQLFCSTTAKPNLYYLPVADDISDLRLKELDNETSRDWAPGETRKGRGMKIEMKYKYTFDEHDRIVEVGEDKGPWTSEARGGRGGYGGFRGRGRGGRGASWRGREG